MLETGDKAPKLKGTTADGSTIRLADYIGKPFVVYWTSSPVWCASRTSSRTI